jgi:hypothetical protein
MKTMFFVSILAMLLLTFSGLSKSTPPVERTIIETVTIEKESFVLDRLTIYNPVPEQTDDTPLITGSGKKIDLDQLKEGNIRWIGLSQDLLARSGGRIRYGDTLLINTGDKQIDGYWIVNDAMNKRFKLSGDLLLHSDTKTQGKWTDVTVSIVKQRRSRQEI